MKPARPPCCRCKAPAEFLVRATLARVSTGEEVDEWARVVCADHLADVEAEADSQVDAMLPDDAGACADLEVEICVAQIVESFKLDSEEKPS